MYTLSLRLRVNSVTRPSSLSTFFRTRSTDFGVERSTPVGGKRSRSSFTTESANASTSFVSSQAKTIFGAGLYATRL
ncbi:hypothetical protein D3C83_103780 [compost metagenome]